MLVVKKCKPTLLEASSLHRLAGEIFADPSINPFKGHWWLAWHDGEAVALAGLDVHRTDEAFLNLCGVMPSHRGQGLQGRLISARVKMARLLGVKTVVTYVYYGNHASANNIFSAGFRLVTPGYRYGGHHVHYFQRTLRP